MFFRKKVKPLTFDRSCQLPVIHSSICSGEKTAGFENLRTGKFEEVCCIRSSKDLEEFLDTYGISPEEVRTKY